MRFREETGKLEILRKVSKIEEMRRKLVETIIEKGHKIKKVITVGTLLAMLMAPTVVHANAPVEFESEVLVNNSLEEILELVNQEEMEVTRDDWNENVRFHGNLVDDETRKKYSFEEIIELLKKGELEEQPPFRMDIAPNGLPIKLLSTIAQQPFIDYIEEMPSIKEIHIYDWLPEEMLEKIKNAGDYETVFHDSEGHSFSNANEYVENSGVIVVYDLQERTKDGLTYKAAYANHFNRDKSIADLEEEQLAYLSIDTFYECEKNNALNTRGEVCTRISSVKELSTEEAIRLKEKANYVQITFGEDIGFELYTIDEYIELSKAIDDIVLKINPKSSDFEKFLTIYYELGKKITYEKSGRRDLYSAMIENSGVCEDIARSYDSVCKRAGLESECIGGKNQRASIGHVWNQVEINGKWIDIDLTNDLDRIKRGETPSLFGSRHIDYDFNSSKQHDDMDDRAIIRQDVVEILFGRIKNKKQMNLNQRVNESNNENEIE
ncbi:MAG: transglutaminase domain-containing protein [Clostridia bacterium]|nr:transglutaminase domain-containing protein [Clostridia bacterium]